MTPIDRRTLLFGAASVAVSGALAGCRDSDAGVLTGSFDSKAMKREVEFRVCRPPGAQGAVPVVVGLHGAGGDDRTVMNLGVPDILKARAKAKALPVAVVTVSAGKLSYYHRRKDGTDAATMIADELLPQIRKVGCDTGRLGLYGLSMGGYGAMHIAALNPLLIRAVAVSSPALWQSPGASAPGAFDSASDYDANSVWNTRAVWQKLPLSVTCGTSDPFYAATKAFVAKVVPAEAKFDAGGHDGGYWSKHLPAQIEFIAGQL